MAVKDPLIEATVKVLSEGSDINRWLKETVDESKDYHPMDVCQVAVALLQSASRRVRPEDVRVADKLQQAGQSIDRIVDSY